MLHLPVTELVVRQAEMTAGWSPAQQRPGPVFAGFLSTKQTCRKL